MTCKRWLLAVLLAALVAPVGFAKGPDTFTGYMRAFFGMGPDGVKYEALHNGFLHAQRIDPTGFGNWPFFEIGFVVRPMDTASVHFTMSHGGDTAHYWNFLNTDDFHIRNLYLVLQNKAEDPDFRLWAGSRTYRGDDYYIFNLWPMDEHNILGIGVELLTQLPFQLEIALAVKGGRTDGYGGQINLPAGASNQTFSQANQRYIFILKPLFELTDNMNLKFNVELHGIFDDATSTYTVANTNFTHKLPDAFGFKVGGQLVWWGDHFWRNVLINFGWGEVLGGWLDTPTVIDAAYGSTPAGGGGTVVTRKDSWRLRFGTNGENRFLDDRLALMTAIIVDIQKPRGFDAYSGLSGVARLMYFFSDCHWQIGAELGAHIYFETREAAYRAQRPGWDRTEAESYISFTPIVRYAMGRTSFGVPMIFLRFGNAFYFDKVNKYGKMRSWAFNLIAGFEHWY